LAGELGGVGLVLGMPSWAMGIYKPIDRNWSYAVESEIRYVYNIVSSAIDAQFGQQSTPFI
jgi:hypothetical protein